MIFAGIVAGGTGSRMGADIPKQFIEISGEAIIVRTVKRFLEISRIDTVYIAVHPDWVDYSNDLFREALDLSRYVRVRVICGGQDRNASVFNIINAIKNEHSLTDDDILLTHDAVRPFVSEAVIDANISAAQKFTVCTTAVRSTDTILRSENGTITETLDRSRLFNAQTPQSFRINAVIEAYQKLSEEQKAKLTDVCGIFTAAGIDVHIVEGSPSNIKITTPFDLKIAEAILR